MRHRRSGSWDGKGGIVVESAAERAVGLETDADFIADSSEAIEDCLCGYFVEMKRELWLAVAGQVAFKQKSAVAEWRVAGDLLDGARRVVIDEAAVGIEVKR